MSAATAADPATMNRGPLPVEAGACILVRWKGGGAYERYVLTNAQQWANMRNSLRHYRFELEGDRIDGWWPLA